MGTSICECHIQIAPKRPVGFITGEATEEISFGTDVKHLARQVAELSPDDREKLGRFADFPRARKKKGG